MPGKQDKSGRATESREGRTQQLSLVERTTARVRDRQGERTLPQTVATWSTQHKTLVPEFQREPLCTNDLERSHIV